MRSVIQRVKNARVKIEGEVVGKIEQGLLVLLAIRVDDREEAIKKTADKIINLRIFVDENGVMNRSLKEVGGEILLVSQFTLYGDASQGNRPSYIKSARPEKAIPFYEEFIRYLKQQKVKVETGRFGAMMEVELINDGPVTIILDI